MNNTDYQTISQSIQKITRSGGELEEDEEENLYQQIYDVFDKFDNLELLLILLLSNVFGGSVTDNWAVIFTYLKNHPELKPQEIFIKLASLLNQPQSLEDMAKEIDLPDEIIINIQNSGINKNRQEIIINGIAAMSQILGHLAFHTNNPFAQAVNSNIIPLVIPLLETSSAYIKDQILQILGGFGTDPEKIRPILQKYKNYQSESNDKYDLLDAEDVRETAKMQLANFNKREKVEQSTFTH